MVKINCVLRFFFEMHEEKYPMSFHIRDLKKVIESTDLNSKNNSRWFELDEFMNIYGKLSKTLTCDGLKNTMLELSNFVRPNKIASIIKIVYTHIFSRLSNY